MVKPILSLAPIWDTKGSCLVMDPRPAVSTFHHCPFTRKKLNQWEGVLIAPLPSWATTMTSCLLGQLGSLGCGAATAVVTLLAPAPTLTSSTSRVLPGPGTRVEGTGWGEGVSRCCGKCVQLNSVW